MNTIKNIEVTVKYEVSPATKLEAAMQRYQEASKALNLIESEATPIIKEIGQKKIECIIEQLRPLFDASEIIVRENNLSGVLVHLCNKNCIDSFQSEIKLCCKTKFTPNFDARCIQIRYGSSLLPITDSRFLREDSILSHWEEWGIYEAIEKKVLWHLDQIAKTKASKAQSINNTLKQFIAHN